MRAPRGRVYGILTDSEGQETPPYIEKWEKEIGTKLEDQQVERMIVTVHNYATHINTI